MAKTNFIKEWRQAAKLSQEALAEKATEIAGHLPRPDDQKDAPNWGRTDVNKYENGKREPPMPFYRAAAAILRCSVDDLILRSPADPEPLPEDLKDVGPAWRSVHKDDRERALNILRQFAT
jgi:transcriptional regulator with XRE-family HTH domain